MVRAKVVRNPGGGCRIFCQRAKYKHWFEVGGHNETDGVFEIALAKGEVRWDNRITGTDRLFLCED